MSDDKVTIWPVDFAVLLDLADHPYDVATTTDTPTTGAVVSAELAKRYERYQSLSETSSPEEPRKRGKSRKEPTSETEETAT